MLERKLVLIDTENFREPLFLEFEDEVPINNKDLIVCNIPLELAHKLAEHSEGSVYFEENIYISNEIKDYLENIKRKENKNEV